MLASFALPIVLATCAPAACDNPAPNAPPPTTTTTTVPPPPTVPPSGWRVCIDTDGATVTEQPRPGVFETFQTGPSTAPEADLVAGIDDVRARYAPWGIEVIRGECESNDRTFRLFVSDQPAPEQMLRSVGFNGYAYVGGWGYTESPGVDMGFVFTERVWDPYRFGPTFAHEIAHGAGLTHPYPADRSIMTDPYQGYGWSAVQVTALGAKFFPTDNGIIVSDRARKHGQVPTREGLENSNSFGGRYNPQ